MILDTGLVRARRRELEMSQRQLAKLLGVSPTVVTALEDGRNHHALKLGFVVRLADVLAVDVQQLLESSADPVVDSESVADLAASVGALLFDTATFTPVEALAEATGHTSTTWPPPSTASSRGWPLPGCRSSVAPAK